MRRNFAADMPAHAVRDHYEQRITGVDVSDSILINLTATASCFLKY